VKGFCNTNVQNWKRVTTDAEMLRKNRTGCSLRYTVVSQNYITIEGYVDFKVRSESLFKA
jgi:hypothetical protein